jgi:adenylosuccinate lyase
VTISPIEERYGRPVVKSIFEQSYRLKCMLKVEIAVAEAQMKNRVIPEANLEPLKMLLKLGIDEPRMREIEKETKHDIMAFIRTVEEQSNHAFKFLHFGLTSNDVIDTAMALQLKEFYKFLMEDLKDIQESLMEKVSKFKKTAMLGRTHGQHASPITFGLKMATYLSEFNRHTERLMEVKGRILTGKAMGPVGTGASMGREAMNVNKDAMRSLGLNYELATGQLVDRDRYVEFIEILGNIAMTCEKIGTEIRNLQRPEIFEVMEYFESANQVGSSSMPSKRNPIESENVCSLSRIIRSFAVPEIEGAITWHERDLTNSALERFTMPYTCILTDFILNKLSKIIRNLYVNEKNMRNNLLSSPLCISENLTTQLTLKGIGRTESHELVREVSMKYFESSGNLQDILMKSEFGNLFTESEVERMSNPLEFTGSSEEICDMVIDQTKKLLGGIR